MVTRSVPFLMAVSSADCDASFPTNALRIAVMVFAHGVQPVVTGLPEVSCMYGLNAASLCAPITVAFINIERLPNNNANCMAENRTVKNSRLTRANSTVVRPCRRFKIIIKM
jgi:hypothetical protein